MSNQKEIRAMEMETVKAVDDDSMIVEGYALRFNTYSEDLGGFIETISPEAFTDLDLSDVRCFVDHDSSKVLGRTTSETLELTVDSEGLYFRCQLPNTSYARDLYENIRLKNVNQCSFAFLLDEDGDSFQKREDGLFERTIRKIKSLWEISIVSIPAYSDTDVAVAQRSLEAIKESEQAEVRKAQEAEQRKIKLAKLELELLKLKK